MTEQNNEQALGPLARIIKILINLSNFCIRILTKITNLPLQLISTDPNSPSHTKALNLIWGINAVWVVNYALVKEKQIDNNVLIFMATAMGLTLWKTGINKKLEYANQNQQTSKTEGEKDVSNVGEGEAGTN